MRLQRLRAERSMRDSTRSAMLIINSGVEKIMDGGESIELAVVSGPGDL